jgi:hypothetical protein
VHQPQGDSPYTPSVPPDPSGIPEPHDILAAEEFGIGTRRSRWPTNPADPAGREKPHDVLAAEEFAMPVPDVDGAESGAGSRGGAKLALLLAGLGAAAILLRRRR